MRGHVLKYLILVLMLLNVFSFSASAQVDWANGVVRATGTGLPSPNMPEVQAKLLAKRAAMSDAYRKLAEVVQGVQVTSETIVKNFVTESDVINTKVQAFIKGALVVDEKQNEDGSYEVTMEAPIYGVGSLADMLLNEVAKKSDQYSYVTGDEEGSEAYTGLLIDARGVEVKPSLAPSVFNTNAEIVYDASMLDSSAYGQGVAAFVESEEDLLNEGMLPSHPFMFAANAFMSFDIAGFFMPHMVVKNPKVKSKVGNKPLVIKAIDPKTTATNVINLAPYNVVVSEQDGKKISNANKKNPVLKNGNVAVIVSSPPDKKKGKVKSDHDTEKEATFPVSQDHDFAYKYRDGQVDEIVKNIPDSTNEEVLNSPAKNLNPFMDSLLKGVNDDFRKVKIIHDWIAVNIAYDSEALDGLKPAAKTLPEIFKARKAVCGGFTLLFKELADIAGLENMIVSGYGRAGAYNVWRGDGKAEQNHAWNAVKLNGRWYLTDVTWDAGDNVTSVAGKSVKGKFSFKYRTTFLLAEPETFIHTHFPDAPREQFLEKPLDKSSFLALPYLTPDFYDYVVPFGEVRQTTKVDSSLELSFKLKNNANLTFRVMDSDYKTVHRAVVSETDNGISKHYVIFPKPGRYQLEFLIESPAFIKGVGRIAVQANSASDEIIPEKLSSWKNEYQLISPRTYKPGAPFTIKVKIPSAPQIALYVNSQWTTYDPVADSTFEAQIPAMEKGEKFVLYIPGPDGKGWTGLLRFVF